MTSPCDLATRIIWRLGNWPWKKTEGHDSSLFTHEFAKDRQEVKCLPIRGKNLDRRSFGQAWHCLRFPEPSGSTISPTFRIDLPKRFPLDETNREILQHVRYVLRPLAQTCRSSVQEASGKEYVCPFWIFQIPPDISASHSDLFNYRSSLLILALMQICGEVMSLANTWDEVFEKEEA
jgi:hypothetical protein